MLVGLLLAQGSQADVHPYLINGPSDERVDIVILGDGFRESEQAVFLQAAAQVTEQMLGEAPFSSYRNYFNVRHLFTVSAESGADDPSEGVFRDTAFGAAFDCFNISRLLCVDFGSVFTEINDKLEPSADDIILVIVNDPQYGGSGGTAAVTSLHPAAGDIAIHEIGHSFGRLADEYTADQQTCDFYGGYGGYSSTVPNIEDRTSRMLIRWNTGGSPPQGWIDLTRPLPSTDEFPSSPGLYDGAALCPPGSDRYRSTYNSKMRSLAAPWDPVNAEQLVKRIHEESNSLLSISGAGETLNLAGSVSLALGSSDEALLPVVVSSPDSTRYEWRLEDNTVATEERLDTALLGEGISSVELFVREETAFVRNDPSQVLRERKFLNIAKADRVALEPNDSANDATVLQPGLSISGIVDPTSGDTVDYFRFSTTATGRVMIAAASLSGPVLTLLGAGAEQLYSGSVGAASMTPMFDGELEAGDYVVFMAANQAAGAYAVALSVEYPGTKPAGLQVVSVELSDQSINIRVELQDDGGLADLLFRGVCSADGVETVAETTSRLVSVTGLENGREYRCSVSAINALGSSGQTSIPDVLVPNDDTDSSLPVWLLYRAQQ